ncbi:hypothetical protein JJD41_12725 [Oxynema sp. CENA135]|uniref:hypothetical protein n=1 Tax=Oxynema sp. CENA135 TaxID=984206 RepID=UPI00190D9103|nr:hypothetical protein [Oxynema sp. CENA135]MBK4730721.1 hypothetical protein [Oxynema sp. CENA135]
MLPKPSFDDRELAESFYEALVNRFCESFEDSLQELLCECSFGVAPSADGDRTFFIVTPNLELADRLTDRIDKIIDRVSELMPGIDQTAVCVMPPQSENKLSSSRRRKSGLAPQFMMAKLFSNPSEHRSELN